MEETRLAMQKRPDSGLPGAFCSRWQENNPLSVLSGGFVQRVPRRAVFDYIEIYYNSKRRHRYAKGFYLL